jgi:hypothetical protein
LNCSLSSGAREGSVTGALAVPVMVVRFLLSRFGAVR